MSCYATILDTITNSYLGFYAVKVIETFANYYVENSNVSCSVPHISPIRDYIFVLSKNIPTLAPNSEAARALLDGHISNSIYGVNTIPTVWHNMPVYDKYWVNYSIYRYIEIKFSTNIPFEMLKSFKQLYPYIDNFSYINVMSLSNGYVDINNCKQYFNTMLLYVYEKNTIFIPQGIDKEAYLKMLLKQGEIMMEEFKLRIGYLNNPHSPESKQYFYDIGIKYRCKLVQMVEKIPNSDINKSKILQILHENNKLNFKDFSNFNWQGQTKTFLWSTQDKTANTGWFRCKETDFSVISDIFQEAKNKELAIFSQDTTQDIHTTKIIGNNRYVRSIPNNLQLGILYDDILNSTNIKYAYSVSKI